MIGFAKAQPVLRATRRVKAIALNVNF